MVELVLDIGADGLVKEAQVARGDEPFAAAAVAAARTWVFEPATRDGRVVASRIRYRLAFTPPEPAPTPEPPPTDGAAGAPATTGAPTANGATPGASAAPRRPAAPTEIVVVGERGEAARTVSLGRAEVREIPGTFGDPFRAVEIMPGVTPIATGIPFFFVRGAPPGNVGYYLDGVRIPLLFHVGVGPSVVNPALMDRVDLYPGGYPARFGRFAGGIVSGETAMPVREVHGEYNLRVFDVGAMVEAPFAGNRGVVLLGGRYSYTALLLSLFSPDVKLDYWDYQARISYDLTPRDRLTVMSFGSYDFLGQKQPTGETTTLFGTQFHRVDLRYDRRLSTGGTLRVAALGGLDVTEIDEGRHLRDRVFGLRTEIEQPLGKFVKLRAGTDLQLDSYDIQLGPDDVGPSADRIAALLPSRTDLAMAWRADLVVQAAPGFEVTPGLRVDAFSSQGVVAMALDPRLSARLALGKRFALRTALGTAHQPPAFVVPVPGFQPGGLRGGLQLALQQSFGLEVAIDAATQATATLYHNGFFNMSDPLGSNQADARGCVPGQFPSDSLSGDPGNQPSGNVRCGARFPAGTVGPDRSGGGDQGGDSSGAQERSSALETRTLGAAYGLELFLKRRLTSHLGGFVSYTLSRSTRSVGRDQFIASFDRTHVANAALAYSLGRGWRTGLRLVYYTGLPRASTPTAPGPARLPSFFRADVRVEKRWTWRSGRWMSFVAEWLNVTFSKEALSTRCTLEGCESQTIGPVTIPSLGLEGGF